MTGLSRGVAAPSPRRGVAWRVTPSGFFCCYKLVESICQLTGVSGYTIPFFCHFYFLEKNTHLYYANSVNPDQTPRLAASDLGLHCLPMFLKWDTKHTWVYITL